MPPVEELGIEFDATAIFLNSCVKFPEREVTIGFVEKLINFGRAHQPVRTARHDAEFATMFG
jgi:hypothetical protein